MKNPFAFWKEMDPGRKSAIRIGAGIVLAIFAAFTAFAVISYFFTWKQDASLTSGVSVMDDTVPVHNAGASLGFRWGYFLVTYSFGLAALALVAFLLVLSVYVLFPKSKNRIPLKKWFLSCFSGAFLFSWLAAFAGRVGTAGYLFGGGIGGRCGEAVVSTSIQLVGWIVTGIILLVLLAVWLRYVFEGVSTESPVNEPIPATEPLPATPLAPVVAEAPEEQPADHGNKEKPAPKKTVKRPVVQQPEPPEEQATEVEERRFTVVTADTLEAEVKEPLPRIDNRLDPPDGLPRYKFPSLDILGDYSHAIHKVSQDELNRNNNKIRATLASYKIQVKDVTAIVGPTVTLYKVYPAPGVKIASIKMLQDDIAISLNAKGVRIVTLSDSVGIEVANDTPSIVPLKQLLNDDAYRNSKAELPVAIGYTISQKVKVFDLADAPHLLVAGATKQGKSVGLNVIVASLLYSKHPSELKFVFIDPKMVEFSAYGRLLHHYLAVLPNSVSEQEEKERAIVKNAKDAAAILQSLCVEMDERYKLLSSALVNNIKLYNSKWKEHHLRADEGHHFLPYIVVVIDEYADLTMSVGAGPESKALARSITTSVIRLAQKGRAAGLHVILATQRPTVDVITGLIKANFPMRIAFRVTSRIDSATILDQPGADKLIGRGDMLLYSGVEMERVQCAFIGNDEIVSLTQAVGDQIGYQKSYNTPFYLPEPPAPEGDDASGGGMVDMKALDERFEEAAKMIVINQRGSTSDLQRRLGMGYAKAGRVMDQLEAAGIVGPQNGAKPREVLVKDLNELEEILKHFMA